MTEAAEALEKALKFLSDVSGPPEDEDEQRRVTSTLHALDHATRLAETASGKARSKRFASARPPKQVRKHRLGVLNQQLLIPIAHLAAHGRDDGAQLFLTAKAKRLEVFDEVFDRHSILPRLDDRL